MSCKCLQATMSDCAHSTVVISQYGTVWHLLAILFPNWPGTIKSSTTMIVQVDSLTYSQPADVRIQHGLLVQVIQLLSRMIWPKGKTMYKRSSNCWSYLPANSKICMRDSRISYVSRVAALRLQKIMQRLRLRPAKINCLDIILLRLQRHLPAHKTICKQYRFTGW